MFTALKKLWYTYNNYRYFTKMLYSDGGSVKAISNTNTEYEKSNDINHNKIKPNTEWSVQVSVNEKWKVLSI